MKLTKWLLTAGCAVALGVPHAWPQLPAAEKPVVLDVSKYKVVEKPTSRLVTGSSPVAVPTTTPSQAADPSKTLRIEPAVSKIVASTTPSTAPTATANNPAVEPGKVKWHRTLADALAASEQSGRPVLLFHMMGQLDKQFC